MRRGPSYKLTWLCRATNAGRRHSDPGPFAMYRARNSLARVASTFDLLQFNHEMVMLSWFTPVAADRKTAKA
jgi:hypothetical protein